MEVVCGHSVCVCPRFTTSDWCVISHHRMVTVRPCTPSQGTCVDYFLICEVGVISLLLSCVENYYGTWMPLRKCSVPSLWGTVCTHVCVKITYVYIKYTGSCTNNTPFLLWNLLLQNPKHVILLHNNITLKHTTWHFRWNVQIKTISYHTHIISPPATLQQAFPPPDLCVCVHTQTHLW